MKWFVYRVKGLLSDYGITGYCYCTLFCRLFLSKLCTLAMDIVKELDRG